MIIIGNGGVGKSSMMRRFCKVRTSSHEDSVNGAAGRLRLVLTPQVQNRAQSEFTGEYKKTIGTDFMRKEIYLDSVGEEVRLVTGHYSS